ncbi:MAG: hypothetical protein ABI646_01900 [Acidobacteriota bacterium]
MRNDNGTPAITAYWIVVPSNSSGTEHEVQLKLVVMSRLPESYVFATRSP